MLAPHALAIRQRLIALLQRAAGGCDLEIDTDPMLETLLVREGSLCGRRYALGSATAVWFAEEEYVKFYTVDGTVSERCRVDELSDSDRTADPPGKQAA